MNKFSYVYHSVTYNEAAYKTISIPTGPCYFDPVSEELIFDAEEASKCLSTSVLMTAAAVNSDERPLIWEGKKYSGLYSVFWKVKNRNIRFDLPKGKSCLSAENLVSRYGAKTVQNMCKWSSVFRVYGTEKFYCWDTGEIFDPKSQGIGIWYKPESAPENYEELQAGWREIEDLLHRAAKEAGLELVVHLDRSFDIFVGGEWLDYPDMGCDPDEYEDGLWGLADYFAGTRAMAFEDLGREAMEQLTLFGQVIVDGCPDRSPVD